MTIGVLAFIAMLTWPWDAVTVNDPGRLMVHDVADTLEFYINSEERARSDRIQIANSYIDLPGHKSQSKPRSSFARVEMSGQLLPCRIA
ncbi:hypothetical protein GCM10027413_24440 [Conyzicola nivalis]|uniref:Uncharacterized protein n=1 Tax=Conyzicola nivalis TaxID=1477021 RepID=A0A916WDL5_9MICO|nr:hypothetical protein GCM10010979_02180 [Conyzicola nivalis]